MLQRRNVFMVLSKVFLMKYLVTGGAGFIGSNLVHDLLDKGHQVIVCDNMHTGSIDNLSSRLDELELLRKNASAVEQNEVRGIDGIYHLGIYSSSPMYKENPALISEAINDMLNILKIAHSENAKLVWASTSSMYNGNPTPWNESMPVHVKDYYGEARYYLERLAQLHHDWYGVESLAMRFFSVYGPREEAKKQYANLVSQFLWAMKENESPVLYGDGTQRRDFIYVDDVVDALNTAMNSSIRHGVFNVGTGRSYSLLELVDILNEELSTSLTPTFVENTIKGYVQETLADTSKAKEELGFEAKTSLREGIKKII